MTAYRTFVRGPAEAVTITPVVVYENFIVDVFAPTAQVTPPAANPPAAYRPDEVPISLPIDDQSVIPGVGAPTERAIDKLAEAAVVCSAILNVPELS
jgi:hypothetical protein